MLRTIDKHNGHVIQKITKPNGATIGYQTGRIENIGQSGMWVRHTTLSDARKALGMPKPATVSANIPKASLPHNQKGYRADNQRKAKS